MSFRSDNLGVWHGLLLVYPSRDGGHHLLTQYGDEYSEGVRCESGTGPSHAVLCDRDVEPPPDIRGQFHWFASTLPLQPSWTSFRRDGARRAAELWRRSACWTWMVSCVGNV